MDPLKELEEMAEGKGSGVNFVPCLTWVKRGVAKAQPEKVKLSREELAAIIRQTGSALKRMDLDEEHASDVDEAAAAEGSGTPRGEEPRSRETRDIDQEYDLDNYDNDDAEGDGGLGIGNLVSFADPREDPYFDPSAEGGGNLEDEDGSDAEDFEIRPTDNLILVGHVEGDASILEVYVYNDVEDALYVHHDILLPSYPLAIEWVGYEPGPAEQGAASSNGTAKYGGVRGNMAAVGSMSPIIDVWDLDMVDALEPAFSLGRKGRKKKQIKPLGHTDAVLALSWNSNAEHVLASGSVDRTVLLWDLNAADVVSTLKVHQEKVQSVQWHPFEAQNLLTGGCDQVVRLFNCAGENSFKAWPVMGEVEKVLWNHFDPFNFFVATDKGTVQKFDARMEGKALWTLNAHHEGVNGMALSPQCPDCLITGSSDKTIKVWDISDNRPTLVAERDLKVGLVHCLGVCPDAPFVVAVGGDQASNHVKVMDVREFSAVLPRFGDRVLQNPLGTSDFGFATAKEADEDMDRKGSEVEMAAVPAGSIGPKVLSSGSQQKPKGGPSTHRGGGGAAGKFRKKDKKKKPFKR